MKITKNNNILCSVSAGYSSVIMAIKLKEWYPGHNIVFAMANTSKERIESLEFMDKCDKYFDIGLVWVEAEINQAKMKGTGYNITLFDNLMTNGEIFEEGIKKYGIPSKINKWCNRELKLVPLKKYADNIFGLNNYSIAVGIRVDEIDRVSKAYKDNNIFYPLIENNIDTRLRNKFWNEQKIKIEIPAYKGNCDLCFEKSNRKLMTILQEDYILSNWWNNMENKYSHRIYENKPSYNYFAENGGMFFFRQNLSMNDLIKLSKYPFVKATDEYIYENDLFDYEDECGKGCSVF